jgi:Spy/CpxP family protein refolding chaperone
MITAVAANAQPGNIMAMADELKLTDQQIEQFRSLRIQHEKEIIPLQADLKLAKLELREIMMKDKLDEKAALAKQDRISDIKARIARQKLQHTLDARKVLNDDQVKRWQKMRMHDGPGFRRHMGDGGSFQHRMCPGPGRGFGSRFDAPMTPDVPEAPEPPEGPGE